jgi:hypothetical protein
MTPAPPKKAITAARRTERRLAINQRRIAPRKHAGEQLLTTFFTIERTAIFEVIMVSDPKINGVSQKRPTNLLI